MHTLQKFLNYLSALNHDHVSDSIAVMALLFTAYQANLSRKHDRVSITPHLVTDTVTKDGSDEGIISIMLINSGLGPAVIKSYKIYYEGKLVSDCDDKKLVFFFDNLDLMKKKLHSSRTILTLGKNYVMAAGEKKEMLRIEFPKSSNDIVEKFENLLNKFDLVINYKSFYKRKFLLKTFKRNST